MKFEDYSVNQILEKKTGSLSEAELAYLEMQANRLRRINPDGSDYLKSRAKREKNPPQPSFVPGRDNPDGALFAEPTEGTAYDDAEDA